MLSTLNAVLAKLDQSKTCYVGYSGGLDSHVLLHALSQFKLNLKAIYINHGLSPNAKQWANHCGHVCNSLLIPFQAITVNAKPKPGQSPEAAAREVRYQAFTELLQRGDYLLTAHHQDDQAETLLLQLLRGAGSKGMASMPIIKPFAKGHQVRPLLEVSRTEILAYAQQHHLEWIEDESNLNTDFDRNFIRQRVMPLLQQRWPAAASILARGARRMAEIHKTEAWFANNELIKLKGSQAHTLSLSQLLTYPVIVQKVLLRNWFNSLHLPMPSEAQLQHMLNDVLQSQPDAKPTVSWQQYQLRRYRDDLHILEKSVDFDHKMIIAWDLKNPLVLPYQLGTLIVSSTPGQGIASEKLLSANVTIRFRQGGERCRPVGRVGSHPLKKLFQEWNVPPWQRDKVVLLYIGEDLAAVVGYCICQNFAASNNACLITRI